MQREVTPGLRRQDVHPDTDFRRTVPYPQLQTSLWEPAPHASVWLCPSSMCGWVKAFPASSLTFTPPPLLPQTIGISPGEGPPGVHPLPPQPCGPWCMLQSMQFLCLFCLLFSQWGWGGLWVGMRRHSGPSWGSQKGCSADPVLGSSPLPSPRQ